MVIPFGSRIGNGPERKEGKEGRKEGRKEERKKRRITRIGAWREGRGRLIWLRSICKAKAAIQYGTLSN